MQIATDTDTPKLWQRFQPVAKLRAWGATLKPNSPLRSAAPSYVAVLRALVLLGSGDYTFVEIAQKAGGISWRQVQRVVAWANGARLIHTTRLPRGRGMHYILMPALAANFLGRKPLKKRRDDMTSKSQQRRGIYNPSSSGREKAPRCDAAPTPRPPPQTGAGETASSGAPSQSGRGHVPSVGAENIAAPSPASVPHTPGRVQRSMPTPAEIAVAEAAFAECREILTRAGPPKRTRGPPGRRR